MRLTPESEEQLKIISYKREVWSVTDKCPQDNHSKNKRKSVLVSWISLELVWPKTLLILLLIPNSLRDYLFSANMEITQDLRQNLKILITFAEGTSNITLNSHIFVMPQLQRNILASNPRVTRFHINWEGLADKMEDNENIDPSPNISGMLPPSCMPSKMPPLGLMPDNSMDCM